MTTLTPEFCSKRIYSNWGRGHQCPRKAVRDGWCKQHHPETEAARKAEQERRWKEDREERDRQWAAEKERERRADCFDELLAALTALHDDCCEYIRINNLSGAMNNHVLKQARAAISKATNQQEIPCV